jgi:hypothetical protein
MHPLTRVNLDDFEPDSFVRPLWETKSNMTMKVYLSSVREFSEQFIKAEFEQVTAVSHLETVLLWKENIKTASLSKNFFISSLDCMRDNYGDNCESVNVANKDQSFKLAKEWLEQDEKLSVEKDGSILSTIQSAGKGMESTSLLLIAGQKISNHINSLFASLGIYGNTDGSGYLMKNCSDCGDVSSSKRLSNIYLPKSSTIWQKLMSNSTIYVHVVVVKDDKQKNQQPANQTTLTLDETLTDLNLAARSNSLLLGKVDLVKYETPDHLSKPGRILVDDLKYLFRKVILRGDAVMRQRPPWDMATSKPEYYAAYRTAQKMKLNGDGYPYWKPEVAVKFLIDEDSYPMDIAHMSGMDFVRVKRTALHRSGIAHIPALHVDEIGMTSDKYIPINGTVTSLPLKHCFDRSDMEDDQKQRVQTATAGGISPARWRLLQHLSKSLESQKELGFEQSDIDDIRRLIAGTNVTLLSITVFASALHMLFEFLAFKSEVSFWQSNESLTGLSVRSLFLDMIGQFIIFLYLIEQDTSLLISVTSAFGILVALWKCVKATGLAFVPLSNVSKNKKKSLLSIFCQDCSVMKSGQQD